MSIFAHIKSETPRVLSLISLACILWAIAYSLSPEFAGVNSQLFRLSILFISSKILGEIGGFFGIPPLIGMLLTGVLFRSLDLIEINGNYIKFGALLRQLALANIMLPAGLGLDPEALKKMGWMVLYLAVIPVAAEVAGMTVASYFLMGLPWLWCLLIGILLAAVSPAVIIPCLFELQDLGYGVNKGIHTLVIAAATVNDIICIALFGIVLGTIFSTGGLTMQILHGPIVLVIGFAYGIAFGLLCWLLPNQNDKYLVTLRTLLLGFGCALSFIGSQAIGYTGAGALGCIIAAFVARLGWGKQGWGTQNPVRSNFVVLWKFFEPISFSLIGREIDVRVLEFHPVLWGSISMLLALLLRIITSFATTQCGDFNFKENVFIAISWIPKATVQAALGPAALELATQSKDPELMGYATQTIIVAAVSILITSPIGAILVMRLGPKLLHRTLPGGDTRSTGVANTVIDLKNPDSLQASSKL